MFRELVPGRDIKLAINEWNTSLRRPRGNFDGVCTVCGAPDDVLAQRYRRDERGVGFCEWMVGRRESSGPTRSVRPPTYLVETSCITAALVPSGSQRAFRVLHSTPSREGTHSVLDAVVTRAPTESIFIKVVNTDAERAATDFDQFGLGRRFAGQATIRDN